MGAFGIPGDISPFSLCNLKGSRNLFQRPSRVLAYGMYRSTCGPVDSGGQRVFFFKKGMIPDNKVKKG